MTLFRWGIVGCGAAANDFATDLVLEHDACLHGAASSDPERAQRFCLAHCIPKCHPNYLALAADPDIDIVYIATTNQMHYAHAKLCIEHGKHVLCEKPLTLNAELARDLFRLAADRQCFLMEVMRPRFLPATEQLIKMIHEGSLGEIRQIQSKYCVDIKFDRQHRVFNPELGGGALLDIGIYGLYQADLVFGGAPQAIQSTVVIGRTDVDETSHLELHYSRGRRAFISTSSRVEAPRQLIVVGTDSSVVMSSISRPRRIEQTWYRGRSSVSTYPYEGNGYIFVARETMRCIRVKLLESPCWPARKTLSILGLMDELRQDWGVVYPAEQIDAIDNTSIGCKR